MTTTAALPTLQELFDKTAKHLLTQGRHSKNAVGCAYRGENGAMCAAGCHIKDEAYDPEIEDQIVTVPEVLQALVKSSVLSEAEIAGVTLESNLKDVSPKIRLLRKLQLCHDNSAPCDWPEKLKKIATNFNLDSAIIATLPKP